jgi:RNA polymerase sigma-B factor
VSPPGAALAPAAAIRRRAGACEAGIRSHRERLGAAPMRPAPAREPRLDERRLLDRWVSRRDPTARDELVRGLLPLARRLARRYEGMGESLEDLVQVAAIGLMKAVDRYDPARGTSLRAYAERMVEGELRHHLRDTGALLHLPRALHARLMAVIRTAAGLPPKPGGGTRAEEIAAILKLTPAEVIAALEAGSALDVRSLDQPVPGPDSMSNGYADRLGAEDAGFELVEDRSVIDRAWRSLDPRERESLVLRLVHDLTYREIAERLGMSVTHVVRLVTRSLERLQAVARASEVE